MAVKRRSVLARLLSCAFLGATGIVSPVLAATKDKEGDWSGLNPDPQWETFELATGDSLLVHTLVAGAAVRALLDSGSAASIVSDALAARLGFKALEQRTIRGMSGRAAVKIIRDLDVKIGRQSRRLPFAIQANLDVASSAFGRPIDMVLGLDALTGSCLALDFANDRYALVKGFNGGRGWVSVPFALGSNRELIISASVAGLNPAPLIFDLGSSTALILSRNYVDEHRLLDRKAHSTAVIGGVEGVRIATAFMVDRTGIAGLEASTLPSLAVEGWLSTSAIGNIGLPLIAQFEVVMDFTTGKLWLRSVVPRSRPPMLKDRSGFGLAVSATALTVVHVAPGSAAARGGWVIGERIVSVDGQPIDGTYTQGSLWRWRFGPAGHLVQLTSGTGAIREIRLSDYY